MIKKAHYRILSAMLFFFTITSVGPVFALDKPKGYPKRPIEMVVVAGPGGGSDIFARTIGIYARRLLKNPLVIINKPGGGQVLGTQYVLNQPADGHTLLAGAMPFIINHKLTGRANFYYTDFQPIIRCQYDTMAMEVLNGGKHNSIQDLINDAKNRPGEQNWGTSGTAVGFTALMAKKLMDTLGIKAKIVPFSRTGKLHAALLGGQVDVIFDEPGPVSALVEAKKMKIVLIFAEQRLKAYPDVPTTKELGADLYRGLWRGIAAKKGTPKPIVDYLHAVFKKSMGSNVYKSYEKESLLNLRPGYLGPDDFYKFWEDEAAFNTKMFKQMGIYKPKN